jgi:hypothetical protein
VKAAIVVLSDPKPGSEESLGRVFKHSPPHMTSNSKAMKSAFCFKLQAPAGPESWIRPTTRPTGSTKQSRTRSLVCRADARTSSALVRKWKRAATTCSLRMRCPEPLDFPAFAA